MNPLQMLSEFQKFQKQFQNDNPGMDPRAYVQRLLNERKVSPELLEQARSMAAVVGVKL